MLWVSAQQIADAAAAGLMPGLPTAKRRVNELAVRERWAETGLGRVREGREGGGGLEYHIDVLPAPARAAWLASHLSVAAQDLRPVVTDTAIDQTADARTVLLNLVQKFQLENALPQTAADAMFAELFTSGSIALPTWIKEAVPSVSARSIARWRKASIEGASTSPRGRPKGSGILDVAHDGEVRAMILAAIAKQPFLSAKHVRILVKDKFGKCLTTVCTKTGAEKTVALPTIRVFQTVITRWKAEFRNELMRLTNPDGYRSHIRFSATGSQTAQRLNEIWQIDASPADVMLKGGRYSIYLAVDVYSRRAIVLVSKTPRASAVGLLVRKCIMTWGVPEKIHTDNGSDFTAKQTKRLFAALQIEVELSDAYEPTDKGIVERTIGTYQRDIAVCPGFIGHSVADRKIIEQRKAFDKRLGATDETLYDVDMDFAEFQEWSDIWAADMYGRDQHAALKKRTPFEVAASYAGPIRKIEHEAALDVLLAPIASNGGLRHVTKQGVRVDGAYYLPMSAMPGDEVLVRMDPADMGRIMLFDPETESYLGEALNADLAGLNPAEVIAKAKAMQRAFEDEKLTDRARADRQQGWLCRDDRGGDQPLDRRENASGS
ncbi:DDE-type integrase/transposase/recombinase [Pseudosulfitobacter pseudonitzschiae]|uniref:DDE-type integrase/transposase/recombinase n=1 Tax=Pseudosulfitobacter pseudonitzschiae TaxID=1402135 RepID=UPI001E32E660|nr:DDE-type integrase/transposase/recombinase [Pseudosulfitobacter pseudonitzschiae]MBM2269292.1 transposase [Pseudosulfitobacter pseudonitzschiae]UFF42962.1 DDE-type integrase/transposase/recombinase [Pseudosulfitobacter pseudonitzschiae]